MSSHKQYQIIDVFCNVRCSVNSYSNSKLNCPQVLLFPEPSLKYSQCLIHVISGQFLKPPICVPFRDLEVYCVRIPGDVLNETHTHTHKYCTVFTVLSRYPLSFFFSKHSSTNTGIIRDVSFEPRTCHGISRQIAGFMWDEAAVLGATTKRRPCSGPLGINLLEPELFFLILAHSVHKM